MKKILNYINGELVEPINGNYLDNYNPSNGEVYSLTPDSEKEDIDNAVASAKEAFKTWSTTPKQERSDILMKLADTIEKYSDQLIKAESKDNGKPETLAAHVDIPPWGRHHETHISAQRTQAQTCPRFPCSHGDQKRSQNPGRSSCQGS
jgi:aminomuconate-semialdehyde/2-hydroxymuconate-6-semialdehyde dehydrogenase